MCFTTDFIQACEKLVQYQKALVCFIFLQTTANITIIQNDKSARCLVKIASANSNCMLAWTVRLT